MRMQTFLPQDAVSLSHSLVASKWVWGWPGWSWWKHLPDPQKGHPSVCEWRAAFGRSIGKAGLVWSHWTCPINRGASSPFSMPTSWQYLQEEISWLGLLKLKYGYLYYSGLKEAIMDSKSTKWPLSRGAVKQGLAKGVYWSERLNGRLEAVT